MAPHLVHVEKVTPAGKCLMSSYVIEMRSNSTNTWAIMFFLEAIQQAGNDVLIMMTAKPTQHSENKLFS